MKALCLLLAAGLAAMLSARAEDPAVSPPSASNPELQAELLAILDADQKPRLELEAIQRTKGPHSPEAQELVERMLDADEANLARISALLDEHGWIDAAEGGPQAAKTIFLVIQHAPLATQLKYLSLMRQAVKGGQLKASSLALLEDRIALREGRPQTYGSQLRSGPDGKLYVRAMVDPDQVDARRASVGLPPMADYVKHWNLTWDVESYKREIAARDDLRPELPLRSRQHTDKALRRELLALQRNVFAAFQLPAQSEQQASANAANLVRLEAYFAAHGWSAPHVVGEDVYDTQFLVIQLSDLSTKKKHLPLLREAVAAGKARPSELADLEKQIALTPASPASP